MANLSYQSEVKKAKNLIRQTVQKKFRWQEAGNILLTFKCSTVKSGAYRRIAFDELKPTMG